MIFLLESLRAESDTVPASALSVLCRSLRKKDEELSKIARLVYMSSDDHGSVFLVIAVLEAKGKPE